MAEPKRCPDCGATLTPGGVCAPCILKIAMAGRHLHVRCPHCHNPVEIVEGSSLRDIPCPSCGSSFSLVTDETSSFRERLPRQLGHFELVETLGVGAFGTVWKARDTELDRPVAIKVPRKDQLSEQDAEQFLREARAAAQLKHPSIVGVHEVGRDGDILFIVSDYIDGITLSDWLTGQRPSLRTSVELVEKVANALHAAHEKGIVHRDLKPSNIMLDADGQPHVMDFGLAKREAGEITMTVDGQVLGTPAYMAPEQARGEAHQADRRADVYALGVILFEMLTGELPFRGNSRMLLHQVLYTEPPSPRKLNGNISRDLETITLKCLEKTPSRRYQSAAELAEELRCWLEDKTIAARPVSSAEHFWRWCRRNPRVAAPTAAAAILLLVIAIGSSLSALWINNARTAATTAANKAESQRQAAVLAKDVAVAAKLKEEQQRQRADDLAADNRRRLVRSYVDQGVRHMDSGDYLSSLIWFTTAMGLDDPESESVHRTRLAGVLRHCPKPSHIWFHDDQVAIAEFDPPGTRVLTVSGHVVHIWDAGTRELICTLRHNSDVRHASFSPTGDRVATASGDRAERIWPARIWDAATGEQQSEFDQLGRVSLVYFSPDGERLLTVADNSASLLDLNSGTASTPQFRHSRSIVHAAFSKNGRFVLTASSARSAQGTPDATSVWDASTGQFISKAQLQGDHAAFSPDGRRFIVAGLSAVIRDTATGNELSIPLRHRGDVNYVEFSPDGRFVLTSGDDSTARLWSSTGIPVGVPMKHRGAVRQATFSRDGRYAVTASHDGAARVWQAASGEPVTPPLVHSGPVLRVALSPDNRYVLTASADGTARLWDIAASQLLHAHLPHPRTVVMSAEFSHNGSMVVTNSPVAGVHVWDIATTQPVFNCPGFVEHAALSRDGNHVVTIDTRYRSLLKPIDEVRSGRIWNIEKRSLTATLPAHVGLWNAGFSPDGERVVVAGSNLARIYDAESAEPLTAIIHSSRVLRARFTDQGNRLTTATEDGKMFGWDAATGNPMTLSHDFESAFHPEFDALGKLFVRRSGLSAVLVAVKTGEETGIAFHHNDRVTSASFDHTGGRVVTASDDRTARVWNVHTGAPTTPPMLHGGTTNPRTAIRPQARFSPDGRFVLTWSPGGSARVWDAASGHPVLPEFRHRSSIWNASFNRDGSRVVTAGLDGMATVWEVPEIHRPLEQLQLLAQLYGGHVIDRSGGLVPLDAPSRQDVYQTLRERYPEAFESSSAERATWHRIQAEVSRSDKQWKAVIEHLEKVLEDDKWLWSDYILCGDAHARLAEWEQAAQRFGEAFDIAPTFELAYLTAVTELAAGDAAGYRNLCARITQPNDGPAGLYDLPLICTLGPGGLDDYSACVDFVRETLIPSSAPDRVLAETLINPDFETSGNNAGTPAGWSPETEPLASAYRVSLDTLDPHGGKTCARLDRTEETRAHGIVRQSVDASPYRGKRVRLSGFLRSNNLTDRAGLWIRIDARTGTLAFENMASNGVQGTQDWKPYDVVLDVDEFAHAVVVGFYLVGEGTVWADDLRLEVVGPDVSPTSTVARTPHAEELANLAIVLYRAGQYDRAADLFQRLMETDLGNSTAWLWAFFAMSKHRAGQADEAQRWLTRLAEAPPALEDSLDIGLWANQLERQLLYEEASNLIK